MSTGCFSMSCRDRCSGGALRVDSDTADPGSSPLKDCVPSHVAGRCPPQCCRRVLAWVPHGVVSRCGFTHQQGSRCCPYMGLALCAQVGSTKTPLPFTMRT